MSPLRSRLENLLEDLRAVGHDPVDAKIEESAHFLGVVNCPDMHREAQPMRSSHETPIDKWNFPCMGGNLDTVIGWS